MWLERSLRVALIILVLCVTGCVVLLTVKALPVLRDSDYAAQNLNRAAYAIGSETAREERLVQQRTKDAAETQAKFNALLGKAGVAVDAIAADGTKLGKTIDSARDLIESTRVDLDQSTLPQLTANLAALHSVMLTANDDMAALKPAVGSLTQSSQNVERFTATLPATGQHVEAMSSNGEAITADAKKVADHYERVITSPVTPVKAVFGYIGHWLAVFFGSAL